MEREAPAAEGTNDRERRERLERLQVEVRQAKAQLAHVAEESRAAVAALEGAVAQAKERLEAERGRTAALRQDVEGAQAEVDGLRERYDNVVVQQLGEHLSEGLANMMKGEDRVGDKGNGPDVGALLLIVPLIGLGGLLLALMVNGCLQ